MKLKKFDNFKMNEMHSNPNGGEITYPFVARLRGEEYQVVMEVSYNSEPQIEINDFDILKVSKYNKDYELEPVELTDELRKALKDYADEKETENIEEELGLRAMSGHEPDPQDYRPEW